MPTAQLGGPIGPFRDNVQQRDVPVVVVGTCDYMTNGPTADPALDNQVQMRLLQAIRQVIGQQMASGQLSFRHLHECNLGAALGEIVAASQLAQMGVQVGNLSLRFGIDGREPAPAPQQAPAAAGPQMPEVRAKIKVGGFNINASSTGGVDTAGLTNQLKDKAKSQLIWYGVGCGILLVVGLGLGGLGLYIWKSASSDAPSPAAAAASKWDGKSPLTCGGNDVVKVEGVTAKLAGTAITAGGNCHLTLVNVNVTAPTGIEAGGLAVVTVQGGSISATTLAVHAGGGAQVKVTGTTITGKTQAEGGAKITGI